VRHSRTYRFQGELGEEDCKKHIYHRFAVPSGGAQVEVSFRFSPARVADVGNRLTLTLLDANGFRGAGHRGGNRHQVHVSPASATPGYRRGPLPGGEWAVRVDTHMIMPGAPCRYELAVTVGKGDGGQTAEAAAAPSRWDAVRDRGSGWYRGDLHCHTHHSDGRWSVAELLEAAEQTGLDFVALTDHNTVSALDEVDVRSASRILTIDGLEMTTYWGHALCLGVDRWIDWQCVPGQGRMAEAASTVDDGGGLFVVAHPRAIGDPVCTGCTWLYPEVMPGPARAVEVWNGPWEGDEEGNEEALALWYAWLNQGHRVVATAGTDAHDSRHYGAGRGFAVVYAQGLSQDGILDALCAGHLYLSSGPELSFGARADSGGAAMAGDEVFGRMVEFALEWGACPQGAVARVIVDGEEARSWPCSGQGRHEWRLKDDQGRWCLVEVRDRGGRMLALTNPIYLRPPALRG
jgi:hypothetical protein